MHASLQRTEYEALPQRLICRRVELMVARDQKIPGIFLRRMIEVSSSIRVKFAVKIVGRQKKVKVVTVG